ncbi:MAG TPA: hypothetical protein VLJ58_20425 [Ramlibacter sp.]|nr:hypothetical protein [Ramlibacter sp.]
MNELPFHTLLYRYFFFGWLFKDTGDGSIFERAAIQRYNREQARWLPTYLLRWLWWGLLFYSLGQLMELVFEASLLITLFYAASSISIPFTVAIATTWLALRRPLRQF